MADNPTPKLRFDAVYKTFGDVVAVNGINLDIAAGSFTALVGASGSGKSTLLKMVNRLIEPTAGSIALDLAPNSDHLPHILRRQMGYVFQGIGLFPHMNVEENILISKRLMGHEKDPGRAAELLDLVELDAEFAVRMPHELSGGQRQRVGVARALAAQPELLLMDEPFGALDPVTRDSLGNAVLALHRRLGLTTIMVTHDMAEALLLADRILVMEAGRIVADETPKSLLAGNGGAAAQALVAVPRGQAEALSELAR